MIDIRKTDEHQYLATFSNKVDVLDRHNFHNVKKRLASYVKPHREITLDLDGIKLIDNGGYKILQELLNMAYTKRCKFEFINAEFSLPNKILKLSDKTIKLYKRVPAVSR